MRTMGPITLPLMLLMAMVTAGEDTPPKSLVIPALGAQIQIELTDHAVLQGKLIAQKPDCLHVHTNASLLVVSLSDISSIKALEKPLANEGVEALRTQADMALAAAKTDVKTAEEEDINVGAGKPPAKAPAAKLNEAENALLQKIKSGNQPVPSPKPPEKADPAGDNSLDKVLDQAIDHLSAGRFNLAMHSLRRIANSADAQLIARADSILRTRFHRNLADTIVICYMQENCTECKGTGVVTCPDCGGQGYVTKLIIRNPNDRVEPGTRLVDKSGLGLADPTHEKEFVRDQLCARCRGHGFDPCVSCKGTRNKFTEPTSYEKSAYADYMLDLGTELLKEKESAYGDTGRTSPPTYETRDAARLKPMLQQVWLRDSANQVRSDIMRLWRAHQYYSWALKADPSIILRSTQKNYSQEITKLEGRLRLLYGEFSERQQVYMDNLRENRLDELNYYENFGKNGMGANTTGLDKYKKVLTDQ